MIIKIPTKWQYRRTRLILSDDGDTLSFPGLIDTQFNKLCGKNGTIRRITSCPQIVSSDKVSQTVSSHNSRYISSPSPSPSPSSVSEQSAFSLDRCLAQNIEFPKLSEQSEKWRGVKLYQTTNTHNKNNSTLNGMNDISGLEIEPLFRIHMKIKNQRNGVLISRDFWV